MKQYKILFCDLDGTLIDTLSGKTFPEGVWDMKIKFDVLDKIKELRPKYVLIASNQGGIESGFINENHFNSKCEYICNIIKEYCGVYNVWYTYSPSNDKFAEDRKPNTGMLMWLMRMFVPEYRNDIGSLEEIKSGSLMIGDASGKKGQFSDSDKKCAENFGIDYMDINDFLNYD